MNKKKIISSLTVAGMLATTAAGAGVFAADTDTDVTPVLGEYNKVLAGKTVTYVKLQSATDTLTGKDLKIAYPGKTVDVSDTAVLKTGDLVKIDGQFKTIIIAGDVNKDGKVNILDASKIVSSIQKGEALTGEALLAANLHGTSVSILDASRIVSTIANDNYAEMKVTLPASESDPTNPDSPVSAGVKSVEVTGATTVVVAYDADASTNTYELVNDKTGAKVATALAYDYAENEATLTTAAMTEYTSDNNQTYTLTIKKGDSTVATKTLKYVDLSNKFVSGVALEDKIAGATANTINSENIDNLSLKLNINAANTTEDMTVVVTLKDTADNEVTGSATISKNMTEVRVNNFSASELKALEEGNVTITTYVTDATGNKSPEKKTGDAGFITLVKNTADFKITNVDVVRTAGAITANVEVEGVDVADYTLEVMIPVNENNPESAADVIADNDTITAAGVVTHNGTALESNSEYTLYVVAINKQTGLKSNVATAKIAPVTETPLAVVTGIAASTTEEGVFTWTDNANKSSDVSGYRVALVSNDGRVVANKTVTEKKVNFLSEMQEDYNKNIKDIPALASYSVEVTALAADDSMQNSVKAAGGNYNMAAKALVAPATVNIENDETTHNQKFTWTASAGADSYEISIYKYDAEKNTPATKAIETKLVSSKTDRVYDLTEALAKLGTGKYNVTVRGVAASGSINVNSPESAAVTTYYAVAPSKIDFDVDANAANPAKVDIEASFATIAGIVDSDAPATPDKKLDSKELTYTLMFAAINNDGNITDDYAVAVGPVYNSDNGKTKLVATLDKDKKYSMYVVVKHGAKEIGRTAVQTVDAVADYEITGTQTILDYTQLSNKNIGAGNIALDGDKILVGTAGDNKVLSSDSDYARYSEILPILKKLNPGKTGVAGDTITITDDAIKVTSNATKAIDYTSAFSTVDLTVAQNNAKISGAFKSVDVQVANADLSGATVAEKVTAQANANVTVKAGTKVEAAGTVTINGTEVTSGVTATATENGLQIEGQAAGMTITAKKDITVEFVGTTAQTGTVTLAKAAGTTEDITIALVSGDQFPLTIGAGVIAEITGLSKDVTATTGRVATTVEKTLKLALTDVKVTPTSDSVEVDLGTSTVNGKATLTIDIPAQDPVDSTVIKPTENAIVGGYYVANLEGNTSYKVASNKLVVTNADGKVTLNDALVLPSAYTTVYNGTSQTPTAADLGYTADEVTVTVTSQTNVGGYTITLTPKANCIWSDLTTATKNVSWTISPATIADPISPAAKASTGSAQSLVAADLNYTDAQVTIGGDSTGTAVGSYTATVTPTANYAWSDGSTTAKNVTWTIQ